MSVVSTADGSADATPVDPIRLIEQRARDLLEADDVPAAREVTEEGLRTSPNSPELLWLLADVEFADGDQEAGMCCLAKAVDASDGDAEAISKQIQALAENNLWRETLKTIEHIPARVDGDPLVRTAVGDAYRTLRCHGQAVGGYGDIEGLSPSTRRKRRRSWLRSGGPFTFVRRRIDAWENSRLLSDLRKGRRSFAQLEAMPNLDRRQARRLNVRSENGHYEWSYYYELWDAIGRSLLRLLPVAFLPVWLVLYAVVDAANFVSGPLGVLGGTAISAVIAAGLAILVVRSQMRSDLTWRGILQPTLALFVFLLTIAILCEVAAAEGYAHHALPTTGWWAWVVFGLIVLPAVIACILVLTTILNVFAIRPINSVLRKYCQTWLLEVLLSVLREIQSPSHQLDLEQRMEWSQQLEWAATRISRDLLPSPFLSDLASTSADWLRKRAAGWAEALRYMQREIVTPVPGGQPKLEAKLRHEILCLATSDLGALAWRQPPPSPSRQTKLARKTIEILRTVLVAVLPLGAVLVSQAVLHFSTEVFRWATIATGVWALLYVVISLDPAIRDKIDTARSLVDTIHDARKSGLSDSPLP